MLWPGFCFIIGLFIPPMTPTLTQYLLTTLSDRPYQRDVVMMMSDLATIGKIISRETNRTGLVGLTGEAGTVNIQGEHVKKLDIFANETCKNYLTATGHFAALASEEEDTIVPLSRNNAPYVIAFDPLDGSSNIDVNVSIGTIFSVYRVQPDFSFQDERQFLQTGRTQVLAGYILYGASTVMVFSFGDGVHEFTLDQSLGEFLLSHERIMVPETCTYYSINEVNTPYMREAEQKLVDHLKFVKKCRARYIGSLVADFHRNLKKGGIFIYPAIKKEGGDEYRGHLRLNYELNPMAFLLEQAGGLAIDGFNTILDIIPTGLHERRGVIMGNRDVVKEFLDFSKK